MRIWWMGSGASMQIWWMGSGAEKGKVVDKTPEIDRDVVP